MDFFQKPPRFLTELLPEGMRGTFEERWLLVLGLGALILLLILIVLLRLLLGKKKPKYREPELEENLADIPKAPPRTGDRRLTIEGVPVRLRLIVIAPAGNAEKLNFGQVNGLLERVLTGLGQIAEDDKPVVRIWPRQLSYEGFAKHFHRNTPLPDGEDAPTNWVLVAGRAKVGGFQIMLGLGLQAIKVTTVGRRTLKSHEWDTVFRIKVRE